MRVPILDHGYLELIETWGKGKAGVPEAGIIEAARQSTQGSFRQWDGYSLCETCGAWQAQGLFVYEGDGKCDTELPSMGSDHGVHRWKEYPRGDEGLLRFLFSGKPQHATPFEFCGMVIEVQAPIAVFREWHRHRTQCLGPDTLIHFDAPKSRENRRSVYKLRIEDIWRKWQPTVRSSRPKRQANAFFPRSRIQGMQLRNLVEPEMEFGYSGILDVIRGDSKPMIRVTTTSGRSLTATKDHRVFTGNGWMTLGEAISGSHLLAMEGTTRGKATRWEVPPANLTKETWKQVLGWEGIYDVSSEGRVRRRGCEPKKVTPGANGYNVVSLSRHGKTETRHVHTLVLEAFVGHRPPGTECRHLNDNRADSRLENLEWGTPMRNAADRVAADRQQRLVAVLEEIADVEDAGVLPSFDLAVAGPWHNFVANGFVVHNSYNEMSARYAPMPDLNYLPRPERCLVVPGRNKQAAALDGADQLTHESALAWLEDLGEVYEHCEQVYQSGLQRGVPKEVARLCVPVGRYSRMRAQTNLRNWLAFLTLRMDSAAQWEIRQYANAIGDLIAAEFPRTWRLFVERA